MLPPKKNQAAREESAMKEKQDEENQEKGNAETSADDNEVEEVEYKNVFEETVVQGKRKHFVAKAEQFLVDWIEENFEEKEGYKCASTQVYDEYLQLCIRKEIPNAMADYEVIRVLKKTFPKGFGMKEGSSLKIKEHKIPQKQVKGDTFKIKMKDIIKQGLEELNNPKDGVMFNSLKKHIMTKFPALQLDQKPKTLLRGLELGLYWGYVELMKGVGRSGRYRWYDPEKHKEEKKEKVKKEKQEGEEKKEGEEGEKSADSAEEGSAEGEGGEEVEKKGDEDKENKEVEEKKEVKKRAPKKKTAAKKKSAPKKRYRKYIVHSDPQRIEDTFPLAMTFMAEPKETSYTRISNYIDKFYDVDLKPERLLKVLDNGAEKGYWELVKGSGKSAHYRLTVDQFDPTDDDDLIGKIVNAIMASVEPKSCSARALKEYLTEFHPDYKIPERPHLFKKALERGLKKGLLRQVTGIGASGTFHLVETFVPSPVILAGKDTASDYEEESESEDEVEIKEDGEVDLSLFMDAYKPRPSKRRGKAREVAKSGGFDKNAAYFQAQIKQMQDRQSRKRKPKPKASTQLKVPKKKSRDDSSSEEESSSSSSEEESESDEEADEEDSTYGSDTHAEKYKPRPTKSRGGPASGRSVPTKAALKARGGKTPAKGKRKASPSPPPAKAKKTPTKGKASPAKKAKPTPAKATPAKKTPAKGKPATPASKKTPVKGRSPGRRSSSRH